MFRNITFELSYFYISWIFGRSLGLESSGSDKMCYSNGGSVIHVLMCFHIFIFGELMYCPSFNRSYPFKICRKNSFTCPVWICGAIDLFVHCHSLNLQWSHSQSTKSVSLIKIVLIWQVFSPHGDFKTIIWIDNNFVKWIVFITLWYA